MAAGAAAAQPCPETDQHTGDDHQRQRPRRGADRRGHELRTDGAGGEESGQERDPPGAIARRRRRQEPAEDAADPGDPSVSEQEQRRGGADHRAAGEGEEPVGRHGSPSNCSRRARPERRDGGDRSRFPGASHRRETKRARLTVAARFTPRGARVGSRLCTLASHVKYRDA
jgi:hypothetical protein